MSMSISLMPTNGTMTPPRPQMSRLRRNLLLYGVGGIIVPFVGIKLIDMLVTSIGLA